MSRQVLVYSAQVGYFFEIAVHSLIAHHGQATAGLDAERMVLVFSQYGKRDRQQRHIADGRSLAAVLQLHTSFPYPPIAVVVLHEVFPRQGGNVRERQTGMAGKDEYVAHEFKPRYLEVLVHDCFQFAVCQEYRVGFVLLHLVSVKRVLAHPFLGQGHVYDALQAFHVANDGVAAQAGLRFQECVEKLDEVWRQLEKSYVFLAVKPRHGGFQLVQHVDVPVYGYR